MPRPALPGLRETRKDRPGVELLNERLYRPLAQYLVEPLARLDVKPEQVVLAHTALGLLAAWQVSRGARVTPALLLQLKTVLDNLDGQLARATNQTSQIGRYLDSEMDLLVNAALLYAIDPRRALPALVTLQLILTADYLLEREYREARGEPFRPEPEDGGDPRLLRLLRTVYAALFEPQERLLGALLDARWRALGGTPEGRARYSPAGVTHVAANLGLTTQLAALGACLALGVPRAYLASLPAQVALLAGVQGWRESRLRGRR